MASHASVGSRLIVALLATWVATEARSAETRFGYQLGVSQSVGTTLSDNEELVLIPQPAAGGGITPTSTAALGIARLQGVQLTTEASANVTLDILTSSFDHALLLGGTVTQLIPTAVPDDAVATLSSRINAIGATSRYLARIVRPRWGFAVGAGYALTSNGRVCTAADGALDPFCPRRGTTNGSGGFVVNGLAHELSLESRGEITRRTWDLALEARYAYTIDGAFTLAPGSIGQAQTIGSGTNIGGFLRLSAQSIAPTLSYRLRFGSRGVFQVRAEAVYTQPEMPRDTVVRTGTTSVVIPARLAVPKTVANELSLGYVHALTQERRMGIETSALFSMRAASDPVTLQAASDRAPTPDTLIAGIMGTYADLLPFELRMRIAAGVAKPWVFQLPFGITAPDGATFETVRGPWTPIFDVRLARRFAPFDLDLAVTRTLGPGPLGASAVTGDTAAFTVLYEPNLFGRIALLSAGVNANQTRSVLRELFERAGATCDVAQLAPGQECPLNVVALAFDNRSLGANVALGIPIFTRGQLTSTLSANYNFTWLDPDPSGVLPRRDGGIGRSPFTTHTAFLTLAFVFGRGPLQREGIGTRESDALDAFSADPRSGEPLGSARLFDDREPLLDGTVGNGPGEPEAPRLDSKQAYEESVREDALERGLEQRTDVIIGNGTIYDDEASTKEAEAKTRERRERERTRKFSEWPLDKLGGSGAKKR